MALINAVDTVLNAGSSRPDRHRIAGTVQVNGIPARRYVVCYDRRTFALIGATISDPATGAWQLYGLNEFPEQALLVVALDIGGTYNAEVADYVSQVATP